MLPGKRSLAAMQKQNTNLNGQQEIGATGENLNSQLAVAQSASERGATKKIKIKIDTTPVKRPNASGER